MRKGGRAKVRKGRRAKVGLNIPTVSTKLRAFGTTMTPSASCCWLSSLELDVVVVLEGSEETEARCGLVRVGQSSGDTASCCSLFGALQK